MPIDLASQAPNGIAGSAFINAMAAAVEAHDAFIEALDAAWTIYTPVWNGTLGNGVLAGRWKESGSAIHAVIGVLWGSTTTGTASQWSFTLPTNARQPGAPLNDPYIGQLRMRDMTGSQWAGHAALGSATAIACHTGANPIGGVVNTAPFTWANTDYLIAAITYERA